MQAPLLLAPVHLDLNCVTHMQPLAMLEYDSEGQGKGGENAPENEDLADHMRAQ